jgi:hypothetical protein
MRDFQKVICLSNLSGTYYCSLPQKVRSLLIKKISSINQCLVMCGWVHNNKHQVLMNVRTKWLGVTSRVMMNLIVCLLLPSLVGDHVVLSPLVILQLHPLSWFCLHI